MILRCYSNIKNNINLILRGASPLQNGPEALHSAYIIAYQYGMIDYSNLTGVQ